MTPIRISAIDIGTNSVRLLVADATAGGALAAVERGLEITRLGEGLTAGGGIAPAAAARTLDAVRRFAARARRAGAEAVLPFGTCALREAPNAREFIRRAAEATGLDIRILSGGEEARLAWRGMTRALPRPLGRIVAVDIGGGSVEVVAGRGGGAPVSGSVRLGCVRMTERFVSRDPPGRDELDALGSFASAELSSALPPSIPRPADTLVGAGGTITTAAAVELGLRRYDPERVHGAVLAADRVRAVAARLAAMSLAERKAIPGIEEKRADIIVAGLVVLEALIGFFSVPAVTVSDEGILHGAILEYAAPGAPGRFPVIPSGGT